jgi:hypothetical protein
VIIDCAVYEDGYRCDGALDGLVEAQDHAVRRLLDDAVIGWLRAT